MKFLTQDYYEILDVAPGADNEAVKRAYRLVRRSFRPDSMAIHSLYSEGETEAIGAKIDEAFRILSRPESAGRYAKYHRTGRPGMTIPRRPEDFFDQVHKLDSATPIEALARAVGGEVEAPPAPVAHLRPRQPARPTTVELGEEHLDENHLETVADTSVVNIPLAEGLVNVPLAEGLSADDPAGAVPESQIDLFLDALEEVDEWSDVTDSTTFVAAAVVEDELDDLPAETVAEMPPARKLDYADVDALLSTVAANPVSGPRPSFGPEPMEPAYLEPVTPPTAHDDRPARPVFAAQTAAPVIPERPAIRSRLPTEPAPYRRPDRPMSNQAPATRAQASSMTTANTSSTTFAMAATTPATRPVQGPTTTNGTASTLASVAAVQRDLGPRPRRWNRDTIRTRAVGMLEFEPLSNEDIEAFEMDCGGMGGAFLMEVRRAVGVSIEDIASRTKISTGMLRYIEADEVEFLPARVYLRGYLTQVGRLLKLPVPRIVDGYMQANGLGKK